MKVFRNLAYYKYIFTKSKDELNLTKLNKRVLVLTIAFNNVEFIKMQISFLKKYLKEEFSHCILDNSTIPNLRNELKAFCLQNNITYVGLPKGPFTDHKSHGAAMHWGYVQVVRKVRPSVFGYLDHDIFPFKSYRISGKLYQGVYGRVVNSYIQGGGYLQKRTDQAPYWSLWAGFCFFDFSRFKGLFPWKLNFLSRHFPDGYFLDTGGGLWDSIYSKTNYPNSLATYRKLKWDSNGNLGDQNENFEIIDEAWIHFVSLSNWRVVQNMERKKKSLLELLHKLSENISNDRY